MKRGNQLASITIIWYLRQFSGTVVHEEFLKRENRQMILVNKAENYQKVRLSKKSVRFRSKVQTVLNSFY